jgi:hypothetical protein
MKELEEAVERLRMEMLLSSPTLAENLRSLEAHLLHTRDATLNHIKHIRSIDEQSKQMIAAELELLREALMGRETPPPIPDIEQRFAKPRFLSEALQ